MPVGNLFLSLYPLLDAQGAKDKGRVGLMWIYAREAL